TLAARAVATADQEDVTQFFTAHQVDQRIRRAKQRLTAKTYGDQMFNFAEREARHLLCLGYHRCEIITFEVTHAWPANDAARPDTIVISTDRRVDDAVRGHHDGTREAGEFHLLILP